VKCKVNVSCDKTHRMYLLIFFQVAMSCHKALRTYDVLECIFSFLDVQSLENACRTCNIWREAVIQSMLWKKLANRLASQTPQNFTIFCQKGINAKFDDNSSQEESIHFEKLCVDYLHFKTKWPDIVPKETLLHCAPADVNNNFNFDWNPFWQWKNQGGWIASFALSDKYLLCGVIETLQVWDLSKCACVSILETPRDDIIEGVDIALNCLDLLGDTAVSGSNEGVIRIWNITTCTYIKRLDCSDSGAVNALKLHQNYLLSGHDDGPLNIWLFNSSGKVVLLTTLVHHTDIVWGLDISSHFIVTCSEDKSIAAYIKTDVLPDVKWGKSEGVVKIAGNLFSRLVGHKAAVTCVSISSNLVVSGSRDKTLRVWKLELGSFCYTTLIVLYGHTELIHFVAQDQDRIYSSDENGEMLVWDRCKVLQQGDHQYDSSFLMRKFDHSERGAIDCIKIKGTKVFTSYDDFGSIAINDFW